MAGFFSGGAKSMSFGKIGDESWKNKLRGGVITDVSDERPQTHWQTGAPVTKDDGTVKTQVVVTTQCIGGGPLLKAAYAAGDARAVALLQRFGAPLDERTDPSDDGRRGIYVKGNLRFDLSTELRRAEAPEPLPGGEVYLAYTDMRDTPSGPGRTYEVLYFAPPAGSRAGGFFQQEQPTAPAAPAQPSTPPPAPSWGTPAPDPQQPAAAAPAASAPADPWGAAPAAQGTPQPPAPSANPWG